MGVDLSVVGKLLDIDVASEDVGLFPWIVKDLLGMALVALSIFGDVETHGTDKIELDRFFLFVEIDEGPIGIDKIVPLAKLHISEKLRHHLPLVRFEAVGVDLHFRRLECREKEEDRQNYFHFTSAFASISNASILPIFLK